MATYIRYPSTAGSQGTTTAGSVGSLTTNGSTVNLAVSGAFWASVKISIATAVSQSLVIEYSDDGGTNYIASGAGAPLVKRVDAVAVNPTVVPANTTTVLNPSTYAASTAWEFVIPSNATNVQVRSLGTGPNTVTIAPFVPYSSNIPVTAVFYDQTSAVNTALNTGTLALSGWMTVLADLTVTGGGTPQFQALEVDDAGNDFPNQVWALQVAGGGIVSWGLGSGKSNATQGDSGANGVSLPRRGRINSGPVASQTTRVRLIVRR